MSIYLQTSAKEITLDVGEDRILLEARKKGYLLDAFVDYQLDSNRVNAKFNTDTKVSTATNLDLPIGKIKVHISL